MTSGPPGSPQESPASMRPPKPFQWCIGSGVEGRRVSAFILVVLPWTARTSAYRCSPRLLRDRDGQPGCGSDRNDRTARRPASVARHQLAVVIAGHHLADEPTVPVIGPANDLAVGHDEGPHYRQSMPPAVRTRHHVQALVHHDS